MNPSIAGQQRERGEHREGDADRRRDRQPIEERDAEGEHAEQGDAHDDPGEEHRATRGVGGVHDRRPRRPAGHESLSVPRHDEQRVVDADAKPDEQHELRSRTRASS